MKAYFYKLLHTYLALEIRPGNSVVEIHPQHHLLIRLFNGVKTAVLSNKPTIDSSVIPTIHNLQELKAIQPDYILLDGNIHYENDIQQVLEDIYGVCEPNTRLILLYYSSLWRPFCRLATWLKWRTKTPEQNWVAPEDVANLMLLAGFEPVRQERRILVPLYIPLISYIVNRYIAPLPFFRIFTMVNIVSVRPIFRLNPRQKPSVSIVVPARNEAGNIEPLLQRLPKMGIHDELIFVEGHSTDLTWETIQTMSQMYQDKFNIKIVQQTGKGKGDAVRKGFELATNDILMILDADMTVSPEDLPKFYNAIVTEKGEFINGSRLVYPMENKAMPFINIIGNKTFAIAFSFVLGQRFKDTLCGTKVLSRNNYLKIAANRSYFGDFDPFGDFDLLFGASRLGLKIVEIPIAYKERNYGNTNIQRWKHGWLLLRMLLFAARKIKFI